MSLDELRAEYEACRIGPVVVRRTAEAARRVVGKYAPRVYSPNRHSWSSEAIDELVHDFVTDDLHLAGQIDYLILQTSEERFDALLHKRLGWYIFDRGVRNEVDRLRERSRRILSGSGFTQRSSGRDVFYARSGGQAERRAPTDEEIAAAVSAVRRVPRVESHATDRGSPVYTPERLAEALDLIADCLPCEFTSWNVHRIFREVLTWTGTTEVGLEDEVSRRARRAMGGQEEMDVREAVRQLLRKLDDRQRRLLSMKLREVPDEAIGRELGVSRPTVAKWKLAVFGIVGQELDGLSRAVQESALARFADVVDGGLLDG